MELALLSLILLTIWSTAWKGLALWNSAHKNKLHWFVVLLVFNTAGILEIIYSLIIDREPAERKYVETFGAIMISIALAWAVLVNLPQLPL